VRDYVLGYTCLNDVTARDLEARGLPLRAKGFDTFCPPGDVTATGTPAGAAPLEPGDRVEVRIGGIGILKNSVVRV